MKTKYGFETTEERSELMRRIRSVDTSPEMVLRKMLWHEGYRYRVNYSSLPGKPDIVFLGRKVAVFIDGEFWHGFNWSEKKKRIRRNRDYWISKIQRNMERDQRNNEALKKDGWTVLRFWEHEVKKKPEECLRAVIQELSDPEKC